MGELIGEETAKAIQEAAKAGGKVVDLLEKLCGAIGTTVGPLAQDAVGLLLGDWLHQKRLRNIAISAQRTLEILREHSIDPSLTADVSPSVLVPLIRAAADESAPELQEFWARLLATALDPSRSRLVRQSFITAVKQMDPLDALVLTRLRSSNQLLTPEFKGELSSTLKVSSDEIDVSAENLARLNCLSGSPTRYFTPFGRELLRACGY